MTIRTNHLISALLAAFIGTTAVAADNAAATPTPVPRAVPSGGDAGSMPAPTHAATDVQRAAVGPRVGGSAADAEFRAAIQKSGADFRKARTECRTKKGDEQRSCTKGARAAMTASRAEAKAKHDQAVLDARAKR